MKMYSFEHLRALHLFLLVVVITFLGSKDGLGNDFRLNLNEIEKDKEITTLECMTEKIIAATRKISTEHGTYMKVCSGSDVKFRAPKIVLKPGFHAERGTRFHAGIPTFDARIVVFNEKARYWKNTEGRYDDPENEEILTDAHFANEIDILNERFVAEDENGRRTPLVKFKLKEIVLWNEIAPSANQQTTRELLFCLNNWGLVEVEGEVIFNSCYQLISQCAEDGNCPIISDRSVNLLYGYRPPCIMDENGNDVSDDSGKCIFNPRGGHANWGMTGFIQCSINGQGCDTNGRHFPTTVLHDRRIGHDVWTTREHEMGHSFYLGHVCTENVKEWPPPYVQPSNIMNSAGACYCENHNCSDGTPRIAEKDIEGNVISTYTNEKIKDGNHLVGFGYDPWESGEMGSRRRAGYYKGTNGLSQASIIFNAALLYEFGKQIVSK